MVTVTGRNERPANPIDTSVPHSARIWNYWLGGKDNYPSDWAAGEEYLRVFPHMAVLAMEQRGFHGRATRFLAAEHGIHQFLDVGTGLPTMDNTHEVAQRVAPDARIVYVDNDPMVLSHARALLNSTPQGRTDYIDADVRDPDDIVEHAKRTLDFSRPVAVMMLGILGHVTDYDQARDIVYRLVAHLVPGSYLVICDGIRASEARAAAQAGYNDTGAAPYRLRAPAEIAAFFQGLEILPPGVVAPNRWRPAHPELMSAPEVEARAAVGRVR
ncbi:SAM-dependent methyltransferase [Actinomadura sp. NPDC023710]|uniref:SAM-dependent methyltransferase n=1 Tax=Actinomadura sp. NPDC023710 TaxID=3158219 RepID=UPI00340A740A